VAYEHRPGQNGHQGQWPGNDGRSLPPQWGSGQQDDTQRLGPYAPQGHDQGGPARHKAITGVLGFVALIIVTAGCGGSGGSSLSHDNGTTTGLTTASTAASATVTGTPSKHATQAAAAPEAQPSKTQAIPVASRASAAPAPAHTTQAPAPPAPAPTTQAAVAPPPAPAAPASCHPLTNGGNCYEAGEFCRNSDHGVSGVAGNGEAITCADNDGWRWEPS
jgi:hypothetical protein